MQGLLSINPHLPDGRDPPPGLNRFGISFPLGGTGLTITLPWLAVAVIGYGVYWLDKRYRHGA